MPTWLAHGPSQQANDNRAPARWADELIAIAITLLVLEIKVPVSVDGGLSLAGELAAQRPSYAPTWSPL
jgi:uncharacterized membrane protein